MLGNSPFYVFIENDLSKRLGNSRISVWATAERPVGVTGAFGYNTDSGLLEVYDGSAWQEITVDSSGSDEDALRYVFMVDG